jgi:hypothetical protein
MCGRVLLLTLGVLLWLAPAAAWAHAPAQAGTATLSVVVPPVEVQAVGASSFVPATDGQTLAVGSQVRTDVGGRAVLTFFDGSTATLEPRSEITLQRVERGQQPGSLLMGIQLTAGRVWAQVTSLIERGSSFEAQAGAVNAVGREGVSGFQVDDLGQTWCWVLDGQSLQIRIAGTTFELGPGQEVGLVDSPPTGTSPTPPSDPNGQRLGLIGPRLLGRGLLELSSEGAMMPRVVIPQGWTVGFPLADLAVNQAQDATTSLPLGANRWIRVPRPAAGVHQIVLQPVENGPYRVQVSLNVDGATLLAEELTGIARDGAPLIAELTVEARDGAPIGAQLGRVQPLVGPAPGNFIYP